MKVRLAQATDISSMHRWLQKHKHASVHELPKRMFAVPGVAVGGVFLTAEGLAMLDSFATNPHVSPSTRHKAFDSLVVYIESEMAKIGINKLIAFSSDAGTIIRARRHGFNIPEVTPLTKRIG